MFPATTRQRCVFEQMDVLAGGNALKGLAGDGAGFDLVHDCGLLDSVAMVIAPRFYKGAPSAKQFSSAALRCRCATRQFMTSQPLCCDA
jgi:hypothetical protein